MKARSRPVVGGLALLVCLLMGASAGAQPPGSGPGAGPGPGPGLVQEEVVGGLPKPMDLCWLPDGRMVVALREGDLALSTPWSGAALLPGVTGALPFSELGLYSIEADPAWPARPYLYVTYSFGNPLTGPGTIRLSMLEMAGDLTDPDSLNLSVAAEHLLFELPNLHIWHQGGGLRFGADGFLYTSIGDDVVDVCEAADLTSPNGKVLRLDVSGFPLPGAMPPPLSQLAATGNPFSGAVASTVWTLGFRNPFRLALDPVNGDLFVGDVGAGQQEEITRFDGPGQHGGWPFEEGTGPSPYVNSISCTASGSHVPPIFTYGEPGQDAVVVLDVYRNLGGPFDLGPEYEGDVFFVDFFEPQIRRLDFDGSTYTEVPTPFVAPVPRVCGGRRGPDGALYFLHAPQTFGSVHRIRPGGAAITVSYGIAGTSVSGQPFSLTASSDPVLGTADFVLRTAGGLPNGSHWLFFALDATAAPSALFGPQAISHLELNSALLFMSFGSSPIVLPLDGGGRAEMPIPLTLAPGALGFSLAFQSATMEGPELVLSNTLRLVIGLD